jgi:hypothetical protein
MKRPTVLLVDAAINLLLGGLLLAIPREVVAFLGLPPFTQPFYPTILGAVLFGIGIALIVEHVRRSPSFVGLGLGGAVVINLCGGAALAGWLVFGGLDLPLRGSIFLWGLVAVLVSVSAAELLVHRARKRGGDTRTDGSE